MSEPVEVRLSGTNYILLTYKARVVALLLSQVFGSGRNHRRLLKLLSCRLWPLLCVSLLVDDLS